MNSVYYVSRHRSSSHVSLCEPRSRSNLKEVRAAHVEAEKHAVARTLLFALKEEERLSRLS
jgi:hypothetical protein